MTPAERTKRLLASPPKSFHFSSDSPHYQLKPLDEFTREDFEELAQIGSGTDLKALADELAAGKWSGSWDMAISISEFIRQARDGKFAVGVQ